MTDYAAVPVPDEADTIAPPGSDDPVCLECGTPLVYSGRGRKPKWCDEHKPKRSSGTSTGRKSSDVTAALAIMDGMYHGVTMALMAVSPQAAAEWNARIPDLQQTNAVMLAGDKKLCQQICKMGQGGGRLAFFAAHAFAVAPVVQTLRADIAGRRKPKSGPVSAPVPEMTGTGKPSFPNSGFFA